MSKIVPNTFQSPNILVDDFMKYLTGDEIKCYLVVVRKTFGWQKNMDCISTSMMHEYTGLSQGTVTDCMKSLTEYGLIIRAAENNPLKNVGISWAVQMNDAKIKIGELQERYEKRAEKAKAWGEKMKEKRLAKATLYQIPTPLSNTHPTPLIKGPQKPLSKATIKSADTKKIIEESNKKIDAILEMGRQSASKSWTLLPEIFQPLAKAFCEATTLTYKKAFYSDWSATISDWITDGITSEMIAEAVKTICEQDGYVPIARPGSIDWKLRDLKVKRAYQKPALPQYTPPPSTGPAMSREQYQAELARRQAQQVSA